MLRWAVVFLIVALVAGLRLAGDGATLIGSPGLRDGPRGGRRLG